LTLRVVVVAVALCWLGTPLAAQADRLLPVDEAPRSPDFFAFRARLLVALARRDTTALLEAVAPEIRNSFGGDNGASDFRTRWRLQDPGSELWPELAAVLALGGTFENDSTFVAPYVFTRFPDSLDAFEYVAVIGENVRVRAEPALTAPILARVSFEVVGRARKPPRALTPSEAALWEPLQLADGRVGYVARAFLRSPIGYRAAFVRRGGRWLMTLFVAGD
jgi:hypothetical protein